jgi:hypothetical protein
MLKGETRKFSKLNSKVESNLAIDFFGLSKKRSMLVVLATQLPEIA